MGFSQAIKKCFRQYAIFSGRASRSEYWWFALFAGLVGAIPILGQLAYVAIFIPHLAVSVRRMHDRGWSGWWIALGWCLWPVMIGVAILDESNGELDADGGPFPLIFASVAIFSYFIFLVVHFCLPGTKGNNRFGPDPLQFLPSRQSD